MAKQAFEESIAEQIDSQSLKLRCVGSRQVLNSCLDQLEKESRKTNQLCHPLAFYLQIRYHSFYAVQRAGAYNHLMNEEDYENLNWLQIFNMIYSSRESVRIDVEKVKPYYYPSLSLTR
ncbi:myo-inositol oxygenase 1 [Perilla frutescens var. hirtella]|uniref:Inositol oxygenase n=1 Tax=Perilla frutescens var. hirtella TaxID=608512 RepID=A0AAD4IVF2_PERFH|nr:myo-inositol oxygenase 1 [Perilla frutescens var. hirtella]